MKHVPNKRSLQQATRSVKVHFLLAGVRPVEVALAAGLKESTISNAVAGRSRAYQTQVKILNAFRKLSGKQVSFIEFWGPLASRRIAG